MNVIRGIDHIYLAVSDLPRSEEFYDPLMRAIGFRKGDRPIAGEPHAHYFNRALQLTLRPAHVGTGGHDPYRPGLHHLCLQAEDRPAVDRIEGICRDLGIDVTPARTYPEYNDDYYAIFFEDPDGIRLEVVARSRARDEIVERWGEMEVFLNPMRHLHGKERGGE